VDVRDRHRRIRVAERRIRDAPHQSQPPRERLLVADGNHEDEARLLVLGILRGIDGGIDGGDPELPVELERLDELCGRARLVAVLHVQIEAHVVLIQENRAEHEDQDDRERDREEHRGLLTEERRDAHDEICADDAEAHSSTPSRKPSRSAWPVSFRKTASRLGLRMSTPRDDAPASFMAVSIFRMSSVCSTLTLMFWWLSWTGSRPRLWMISAGAASTVFSVRTR